MSASDYDFNATRNEIIERAYRLIGKFSMGETLSSDMYNQALLALNSMVQSWQSKNVFLWSLKQFTLTLTSSTASYDLGTTDPLVYAIDRAYLRMSETDLPLEVASFRQYADIYNKTTPGNPQIVAIDNSITVSSSGPTLYVWPVPTQTLTLYYLGIVRLKDFDTASYNYNFPVRYVKALTEGLASELAPEFGLPIAERKEFERKAANSFAEAKSGERERADSEFVEGAFK